MCQVLLYRIAIVDACGDCKRRVIALLDQVFPEYDKLFSDTFGKTSSELLLNCPTPEDMLAISTRKLTNILNKASHGRFGKEKAEELKAAAKDTFGVSFAKDAFAFQIKQLMQQIIFTEDQLSELEEQISVLLHETNQYITTITGIGDVLGAIIVSEIGDIDRFEHPNQLVAFAGLMLPLSNQVNFQALKIEFQNVAHHICEERSGLPHSVPLFATLFYPNTISLSEREASIT